LSLSTSRQLNVSMIVGQNDDMAFGARRTFEELSDAQERDRWLVFPLPDATVLPDLDKNGFDRDGWRRPSFSSPLMGDAMQLLVSAVRSLPNARW
jgi:hypothetical protein